MKYCPFILLFAILLTSPAMSQNKGGRWQFEGNGEDSASWDGVENNGFLQGSASFTATMSAPEGSFCLWLDSANVFDYFMTADQNELDFDNEDIAISAWLYPTVINDVHFILNKGTQTNSAKATNYAVRIAKSRKLEFLIRDGNNQAQTAASGFTIPLNQWSFVAVYYNYSAGKVYFCNQPSGPPIDSLAFRYDYFSNDGPLSIGSWYRDDAAAPSIKDFEGGIDDVRISSHLEDIFATSSGVQQRGRHAMPTAMNYQIFPNPLRAAESDGIKICGNPTTTAVSIFNLLGQKVFESELNPGQTILWPLGDRQGAGVQSGLYLVQFVSGGVQSWQKVTILK
jgi:hypothetical protein